ncbi:hypothetical protein XarbCFBP8153_17520 [Xanthomonas arboricola]|nr:hypothetical protein XarbCFBP8153_17520 [Xanthomonas arboricola]
MPRKSLHGRTCGVSCDGGRARTLQPSRRSSLCNRCIHTFASSLQTTEIMGLNIAGGEHRRYD